MEAIHQGFEHDGTHAGRRRGHSEQKGRGKEPTLDERRSSRPDEQQDFANNADSSVRVLIDLRQRKSSSSLTRRDDISCGIDLSTCCAI